MTEKERMLSGKLYFASDEELKKEYHEAKRKIRLFNQTDIEDYEKRSKLLNDLLGSMGKGVNILPPFYCDYGYNIHVGDYFFANHGLMMLDVCQIVIGDEVMLGPNVSFYPATHPIDAKVRSSGLEYGKDIHIGHHVWIGGNTVIQGGVTIGDRSIIGAGSIVTKDIPSDVIAAGNPCKVIRKITEKDQEEWAKKAQNR